MALNFRQFWDEVQARRDGTSSALAGPSTIEKPQANVSSVFDHSKASYGSARVARQGGVSSGIFRPEHAPGFRA